MTVPTFQEFRSLTAEGVGYYARQSHLNDIREYANKLNKRVEKLERMRQADRNETNSNIAQIRAHHAILEYNLFWYFSPETQSLRREISFLKSQIEASKAENSQRFKELEDQVRDLKVQLKDVNERTEKREKNSSETDKLMEIFKKRLGILESKVSQNYPYAQMNEIERKFLASELQRLQDSSK